MINPLEAQQEAIRKALAEANVESSSGEGLVRLRMSGDRQIRSLQIDPENPLFTDHEALEDHLILAVNQALQQAATLEQEIVRQWMSKMLPGGLDSLKGLFGQ
jgi:nucleoid-associated protein EbfC